MTEVVVTTGAIRRAELQSKSCHQQTNTQLFMGRMPCLLSNQQYMALEGDRMTGVVFLWTLCHFVT